MKNQLTSNPLIINKMRALLITSIFVIPLSFSSNLQAGKFYKWVDENGATHYTETPPANSESTTIRTQGKDPKNAEQAKAKLSKQRESLTEDIANRVKAGEEASLNAKNSEVKKNNCKTARGNLKVLQEHGRIKQKNKEGEYSLLPEEKRQERVQKAKDRIKEFCN